MLAAQDYLLSLGITGWQDAIVGSRPGLPDPVDAYLRASAAGTLLANVVGAMWWERDGGMEQVAEMIAQEKLIEADMERNQNLGREWGHKAELAVSRNADDLAKEALRRNIGAISRELDQIVDAWRNPPPGP